MIAARAGYRTQQFLKAVRHKVDGDDFAFARRWLPERLFPLFSQMSTGAQRHHLDVATVLVEAGARDADLVSAGLLHDVGKGKQQVVNRIAFVLLAAVDDRLPEMVAGKTNKFWPGLSRMVDHPENGARLVAAAGGSDRLVWLIRHHQDRNPLEADLRLLQSADNMS